MPGLTCRICSYSVRRKATKTGSSGRGPTRLILPVRTFQSCGSSSSLVFASTLPIRVKRSSSAAVRGAPVAPTRILRNLSIANSRPARPTRRHRWKTGPRLSSLTASAVNANTGRSTMSADPATTRSSSRLRGSSALEVVPDVHDQPSLTRRRSPYLATVFPAVAAVAAFPDPIVSEIKFYDQPLPSKRGRFT